MINNKAHLVETDIIGIQIRTSFMKGIKEENEAIEKAIAKHIPKWQRWIIKKTKIRFLAKLTRIEVHYVTDRYLNFMQGKATAINEVRIVKRGKVVETLRFTWKVV